MGAFFGAKIPFAELCGIELIGAENGTVRVRVALDVKHVNAFGVPHGGLVATLMDIAMGLSARLAAGGPVMTLDMHVSFPAVAEGSLTAEGHVVHAGGSIFFCEAEARDAQGALVSKSNGVFKRYVARAGAED
ncbi:MAG TPA: PaaI family thioesterase [Roseiarcus sp.]|nr:PaaI family thioesterase [Roseiarcus sp.]